MCEVEADRQNLVFKSIYSGDCLELHNYKCKTCFYDFSMRPNNVQQGQRCPKCAGKVKTQLDCENDASAVGIRLKSVYLGKMNKLHNYECLTCFHEFSKQPNSVQQGRGCPRCGRERSALARRVDLELVKATILERGFVYNYSFYKNGKLWVNVTCPRSHDSKDKTWDSFRAGHGCSECYHLNRTIHKNPIFKKMTKLLRRRLHHLLKSNATTGIAVEQIGCTGLELRSYLESKFQPGMNWGNYGRKDGWHMDHILPFAGFDLNNSEEVKLVCHYTNLQPLWAHDNLVKGAKR
jgi:predicted Zn-ribbon and HTH transcriptional regulator